MRNYSYSDERYRKLQSEITKRNWEKGVYSHMIKEKPVRVCRNIGCNNTFQTIPSDPKKYCGHKCSAHVSNKGRKHSLLTKRKISKSISSLPRSIFNRPRAEKVVLVCGLCKSKYKVLPYMAKKRKFCGTPCASKVLGRLTTSPKASKGKNGIRKDIDSVINFYSTWEANVARVYNLVNIKWEYAPKRFDLGEHTYRPDFYLIDYKIFVEVKNFMSDYSLKRDTLFRQKFPNIPLDLIMKEEYTEITKNYKNLVDNWES